MELKKEMKYFEAVTYDNQTYHFAVTEDGGIYCVEFGLNEPAYKIEFKPNFVLRSKNGRTLYSLDDHLRSKKKYKTNESLISEWIISKDLLEEFINERKIIYSTFSAELFGFDKQYAFDSFYQKRFCKKTRHNPEAKAKRLAAVKAGKFH